MTKNSDKDLPRVFITHSSKDKDRFVTNLAKKLTEKGVDVWLDEWEILPGDNLVKRIFEEGIKNAQVMIIVLSNYSVESKWVIEELSVGVIRRILDNIKLIPIIIDQCEIPTSLSAINHIRIDNLENYSSEFDRLVHAIFDSSIKPQISSPPMYMQDRDLQYPDLSVSESLVMTKFYEEIIEQDNDYNYRDAAKFYQKIEPLDITKEKYYNILEVLDHYGYVKISGLVGQKIAYIETTSFGLEEYAQDNIDNFNNLQSLVVSQIVNSDEKFSSSIAKSLNSPHVIIKHILEELKIGGYIETYSRMSGRVQIISFSPAIRRILS